LPKSEIRSRDISVLLWTGIVAENETFIGIVRRFDVR
jgi:hypothetical protein